MKKCLSLLLSFLLLLSLIPTAVFAADGETNVEMAVSTDAVSGSLKDVRVGDTVTVQLSVKAMTVSSFTCGIAFDKEKLQCVQIVGSDPEYPDDIGINKTSGKNTWVDFTAVSTRTEANNNGTVGFALGGAVDVEYQAGLFATITFNVIARGDCTITLYEDTAGTDTFKSDSITNQVVSIVEETASSIALTGMTAPVKGAEPSTTLNGSEQITVSVAWFDGGTEVSGRFQANTAYTAQITVKPAEGYEFPANPSFTVDGEAWSVSADGNGGYVLTKTYPATAGQDTPTLTAPTAGGITYGDTLAESTLTGGSAWFGNTEVNGSFAWKDNTIAPQVSDSNTTQYTVVFTPTDSVNYATAECQVSVTVSPKNISVEIADIPDQTYTGEQICPDVTVTGDSKTLVQGTDYTVEYGANMGVGSGSVTVKAVSGGNYAFNDATKTFSITAKAASITISDPAAIVFDGQPVTAGASGTGLIYAYAGDGAVIVKWYADSNGAVGSSLTGAPTNAGTYWIGVSAAAGTNYGAVEEVTRQFTISPREVAVTWSAYDSYAYTGTDQSSTVTAKYTDVDHVEQICTVSFDSGAAFQNAGTYTATASTADGNYTLTNATKTLEIGKVTLTPSVSTVASKTYDGKTDDAGTISLTGAVNGEAPTAQGTFTWTSPKAGTATVHVTGIQLEDSWTTNYALSAGALSNVTAPNSVKIGKASISGGLAAPGKTVLSNTVEGSDNKAYTYDLSAIAGVPTDAGAVTYSYRGKSADYIADTPTVSGSTLSFTVATAQDADTTGTITVTVQSENYEDKDVTITLTFKSKTDISGSLTLNDVAAVYGDPYTVQATGGDTTGTWTYTYTGTGETSYDASTEAPKAAGTYTVTASYEDDIAKDDIPGHVGTVTANLTISKREVTVAAGSYAVSKTYDGTNAAGTSSGALAVTGILSGDTAAVTPTIPAYNSADVHTENLTVALALEGADSANYELKTASVSVPAEITKATMTGTTTAVTPVTMLANDGNNTEALTKASGNPAITLPTEAVVSYGSGLTSTLPITWADAAEAYNVKGGTYTFQGTVKGENFSNTLSIKATITVTPVTITGIATVPSAITKAKSEVTGASSLADLGFPETVTLTYDNSVTAATVTAAWDKTLSALQTLAGKVTDTQNQETTVTLTNDCFPAWATYSGTMPATTFTATSKYPVKVTVSATDKTYDGTAIADPAAAAVDDGDGLAASSSWKFTYTKTGAAASSAEKPKDAGTYTVTAEYISDTHYGKGETTVTITPKEVGLTWNDPISPTYDGTVKTVTATATGLVGGDACEVTLTGNTATKAGTYTAKAAKLSNPNYQLPAADTHSYTIDKAARNLTVDPAALTLIPGSLTGAITASTDTDIDRSAAITYTSGATAVATVSSAGKVTAVGNGAATITVSIAETDNYRSASKTVTVNAVTEPITGVTVTGGTGMTATVSGTTIKVTGTTSDKDGLGYSFTTPSVSGVTVGTPTVADGKVTVTVNGKEIVYTLDTSAVTVLPASVTVSAASGSIATGAENALPQSVIDQAEALAKKAGEASANVEVNVALEGDQLKATYTITSGSESQTGTLTSLTQPITVKIPSSESSSGVYVKRTVGSSVEYLPATGDGINVTFQTSSLTGTFEVVTNADSVTVTFQFADGREQNVTYTAADIGKALPADSKSGSTFNGWTIGDTTYKTVTEALLGLGSTQTARPSFTQTTAPTTPSTPSHSGGGGGSVVTPTYSVTTEKAKNGTVTTSLKTAAKGVTVTVTVKPDAGYELDTLRVTDKDGDRVKVTEGKNGKFTFTMPDGKVTVEAFFTEIEEDVWPFTDVAEDFWARDAIAWAYENGYMNGSSATTFNPNGSVTRQQLWMILARLSGQRPANMAEAKDWAVASGVSDGTNPGAAVSRQQMATILYRYAAMMGYKTTGGADLTAFPDYAKVAGYAQDAMSWSVANGIVGGTAQGTLNPAGTANRAQFAAILQRFYENVVE